VLIADGIRSRVESVWRRRPHVAQAIGAATAPAAKAMGKTVAVGFELMPRRAPPLPNRPDTARSRSRRQRRAASLLAVLLLLVAGGIGVIALGGTVNGLYAADPGAGRLWKIFGDPTQVAPVLATGTLGVGAPRLVGNLNEVVYSLDDQKRVWRVEGPGVADVTPDDSSTWKT